MHTIQWIVTYIIFLLTLLIPRDDADNNGLTIHNTHTDTDYTIVKDYINHIHENNYY